MREQAVRQPRFHLKIATLLTWLVSIGLALAPVAQQRAASRREQALKSEWAQDRHYRYARQSIDGLVGDLGVVILRDATGMELLRVPRSAGGGRGEPAVTAAGMELD